jgi:hypothetical protein
LFLSCQTTTNYAQNRRFIDFFAFFSVFLPAQNCFPTEKLPPHISVLTHFGQRAEWSLDGKTVYFLDKPGGEVWAVDIKTKDLTQITKPENRPQGYGYYRVMCLANGDLLLCGGTERHYLSFEIMDKTLKNPPQKIEGEALDEGLPLSILRYFCLIFSRMLYQRLILYLFVFLKKINACSDSALVLQPPVAAVYEFKLINRRYRRLQNLNKAKAEIAKTLVINFITH